MTETIKITKLADDDENLILAHSTTTSPDILEALFTKEGKADVWLRSAIAANPSTPLHVLESIASVRQPISVLLHLVFNSNLPETILHNLFNNEINKHSAFFSSALACNTNISEATMISLAHRDSLRGVVAINPNVTLACLKEINYSKIYYNYGMTLLDNPIIDADIVNRMICEAVPDLSEACCNHPLAEIESIFKRAIQPKSAYAKNILMKKRKEEFFDFVKKDTGVDISSFSSEMIENTFSW
jgi:hypothetical protein